MASTTASEVSSAVPGGPPPVLAAGDCDLYWLNLLHVGPTTEFALRLQAPPCIAKPYNISLGAFRWIMRHLASAWIASRSRSLH